MISLSVIAERHTDLEDKIIQNLNTFRAVLKVAKDIYLGFHDDNSEIFKEKNAKIKFYIKALYGDIFS
jgi:hypothetical protein